MLIQYHIHLTPLGTWPFKPFPFLVNESPFWDLSQPTHLDMQHDIYSMPSARSCAQEIDSELQSFSEPKWIHFIKWGRYFSVHSQGSLWKVVREKKDCETWNFIGCVTWYLLLNRLTPRGSSLPVVKRGAFLKRQHRLTSRMSAASLSVRKRT